MSQVLKLIEKQAAAAHLRERPVKSLPEPGCFVGRDGIAYGPCLLISRECGSGGNRLAQMVGQRLGWSVFDSQMVEEIAREGHIQRRLVHQSDECIHSRWEQTWRDLLMENLPDAEYLKHLSRVVLALGHQGHVVLVGRGAQFFLPAECAVTVRLVAPLQARAQRIAERDGIAFEEARAMAERIDVQRSVFLWKVFRKNVSAPLNYDLTVNTAGITEEAVAEIVLTAIRAKLGIVVLSRA